MKDFRQIKPGNPRGWLIAAIFFAIGLYFLYVFLSAHGISGLLAL